MTDDLTVLNAVNGTIDSLLAECRQGLHGDSTLREQMARMERVAEQFDLAGMHDSAARLRRQLDSLVPLRRMEDQRVADAAKRAERNRKLRRILTLGLAQRKWRVERVN